MTQEWYGSWVQHPETGEGSVYATLDIGEETPGRYLVQTWEDIAYGDNDNHKRFQTLDDAVAWGRKQLKRRAHQVRVVDLEQKIEE